MNKFITYILVFLLVFSQVTTIGFATMDNEPPVFIKASTDLNKIEQGDIFTLTLTITPKGEITIEEVGIGSSPSFVLTDSNFRKPLSNGKVTFRLKYNGGTNYKIPITVYYTVDGSSNSYSYNIDLPNVDPTEPEKTEPIDESKIIPSLSVVSSKTITGEAGESISIPVTVRNSSSHNAEDITVTAEIEGNFPISISGSGYENISRLGPGRESEVDFRVNINKNAESNTYPIKINFRYYNRYGIPFTGSDTIYVKVENKNTKPFISVSRVDIIPKQAEAGKATLVEFELKNNGTLEAKDIKVSLNGISNDTFSISSGINSQYVQGIPGGKTAYVHFEIIPSLKLAGGTHSLDLMLEYKDINNQSYQDSSKFFIDVASNKDKISSLVIENLVYPDGAIGQERDVNISFNIKNIGKIEAKNIVVTLESMDQNGLVPRSLSIQKINSLPANESKSLSFVFRTTDTAETKNHPILIKVEYDDDLSQEKRSLEQYVGIFVVEPGEEGKPKLIIDKYSFEPNIVRAGENFVMNLSFFNTNSQQTIKNIKIFLTANETTDPTGHSAGSNVFTPVNSSNTFYIDSIPPKGRVEKSITMFTVPDAQAKTYTITANFEYENREGEEFTATELIGVPVVQQSKLELGEISLYPEAYVGEPNPVYIEFYNTGKVTLYNMMVKLEGDFQTENGSYYVGNFEIGRSDYFEGMVIPMAPGELTGALVFTYEDSAGETVEVRREFTMNVMEAIPMEDFPQDMPLMPEDNPSIFKKPIFWIIIVLILAIGGFVFYKKRKKKGMALDE